MVVRAPPPASRRVAAASQWRRGGGQRGEGGQGAAAGGRAGRGGEPVAAGEPRVEHVERVRACHGLLLRATYRRQAMVSTWIGVVRDGERRSRFFRAYSSASAR